MRFAFDGMVIDAPPASGVPGIRYLPMASGPTRTGS